jgi:hypothetical protein
MANASLSNLPDLDTGRGGDPHLRPAPTPGVSLAPASGRRALTTRFVDFWLLGGASLLVWAVMWVLQDLRSAWAVDSHFKNLTVTTISLSLLVNNPHFLISYKLAYSRGAAFILAQWWQLLAVPALLLALFVAAFVGFTAPTATVLPFVPPLVDTLTAWGASASVLAAPRLGDLLFTLAFNVMFFTVGWHYTKQAFGCMMLYAHFDGYRLTPRQRGLIKWNLLSLGWLNLAYGSQHSGPLAFSHYSYYAVDLPDVLAPLSACVLAVGFVLVVWTVFHRKYAEEGQLPSLNMLVPYVAMYVWWLPLMRQHEFYFMLIPLFHSLQYLVVAGKCEHSRLRSSARYEVKATAVVLAVVAAGWLSFDLVPSALDARLGTFDAWRIFFFFTAAMLFINIHHYFIDNVIWRFRDPVVKQHLLG